MASTAISGSQMFGDLRGGNDQLDGGEGGDTLAGDVQIAMGGNAHGGNDRLDAGAGYRPIVRRRVAAQAPAKLGAAMTCSSEATAATSSMATPAPSTRSIYAQSLISSP